MAKREKKGSKAASAKSVAGARIRNLTRKQRKQVSKKEVKERSPLPTSFSLVAEVVKILRSNWKTLGGIVLVYLALNIIFGISNINSVVTSIKDNLQTSGGHHFINALSGFGSLVGSAGASGSQTGSILQTVLIILESLVIIWALRQLLSGNSIGIKESYYRSMTPLIPFILIILVIFLQLLPLTLGAPIIGAILGAIFNSGATLTTLFVIVFSVLVIWSVYMISSSIFAMYIVTLPDMQPRQALRSAKSLVQYRRWQLMRRVIFLPIFVLVVMAVIVVPLILLVSFLVAPVFYILSMVAILFIHTYLYSLYRSMLD